MILRRVDLSTELLSYPILSYGLCFNPYLTNSNAFHDRISFFNYKFSTYLHITVRPHIFLSAFAHHKRILARILLPIVRSTRFNFANLSALSLLEYR
jgi:hypothetical protein